MPVFEKLMGKISAELEKDKIPYMVVGAQAVLIHGEPRFTGDIDITLGVDTDQVDVILRITRTLNLTPADNFSHDFVKRNALLTVEDKESGIAIDFMFSFFPYERQAINRALSVSVGDTRIRFATAEDTIIHKLFSGRPRDIEDVKGIINYQESLDKKYLKHWLKKFSDVVGRDLVQEYDAIEASVKK